MEKTVKVLDGRRYEVDTRIESLKKDISQIKVDHEKVEGNCNAIIKEREPKKAEKMKELEEKSKKLQNMKAHTSEMNEKMVIMAESKVVMVKVIEKTNEEIDELT